MVDVVTPGMAENGYVINVTLTKLLVFAEDDVH